MFNPKRNRFVHYVLCFLLIFFYGDPGTQGAYVTPPTSLVPESKSPYEDAGKRFKEENRFALTRPTVAGAEADSAVTLLTGQTLAGTEVRGAEQGLAIGSIIPTGKLIGGIAGDILAAVKPTTATALKIADDANRAWDGAGAAAQLPLPPPSVLPKAGGAIRSFVQETDQIYYRVFTDSQRGPFLTAVRPRSSGFAREALALPPQNTARFIQEVLVPAGTRLQRSRALPAFGRRGGAEQFQLLDNIPNQNFGSGTALP